MPDYTLLLNNLYHATYRSRGVPKRNPYTGNGKYVFYLKNRLENYDKYLARIDCDKEESKTKTDQDGKEPKTRVEFATDDEFQKISIKTYESFMGASDSKEANQGLFWICHLAGWRSWNRDLKNELTHLFKDDDKRNDGIHEEFFKDLKFREYYENGEERYFRDTREYQSSHPNFVKTHNIAELIIKRNKHLISIYADKAAMRTVIVRFANNMCEAEKKREGERNLYSKTESEKAERESITKSEKAERESITESEKAERESITESEKAESESMTESGRALENLKKCLINMIEEYDILQEKLKEGVEGEKEREIIRKIPEKSDELLAQAFSWLVIGAALRKSLTSSLLAKHLPRYFPESDNTDIAKPKVPDDLGTDQPGIAVEHQPADPGGTETPAGSAGKADGDLASWGESIYDKLTERFQNQYNEHPSIKMMTPDSRLFPKGLPAIESSKRTAKEGEVELSSIKDMILRGWERPEKKHILLVGEGGIGKTVAMLTLPKEDWFIEYRIPVIYIPLQGLDVYEGNLKKYIDDNYRNENDAINKLATMAWKDHPNLIMLLDGFNEIPVEFRYNAEKHIRAWMDKPGVQIITTSRINAFLNYRFQEFTLQPLQYETCRDYLLSTGISENDLPDGNIWKVINVPLMLTLYTQIEKVKEATKGSAISDYLDWKDSDNAAHVIWDYLQAELYRLIDSEESPVFLSCAILAVATYVCYEMAGKRKYYIEQEEFRDTLQGALAFFSKNRTLVPKQMERIVYNFDPVGRANPFEESKWADYFEILVNKSVLFCKKDSTDSRKTYYVPAHQCFMDALAAFFISQILLSSVMRRHPFPKESLNIVDFDMKNYVSDFLTDDELVRIWDYHRKTEPENGNITILLMDLLGNKRNYDFRELNFSGLDFSEINIYPFISRRQDICPLPLKAELFKKTKISKKSFTLPSYRSLDNIVFSNKKNELFAIGINGGLTAWNLTCGTFSIKINDENHPELAICGQTGRFIVWVTKGFRALMVNLYDSVTHDTVNVFLEHSLIIERMAITPDERLVAVYGIDQSNKSRLEVLNLQDMTTLIDRTIDNIMYMSFDYNGSFLGCAVMTDDSMAEIVLFDMENNAREYVKKLTEAIYDTPLVFSRDLRYFASTNLLRNNILIWNLETGKSEILEFNKDNTQYFAKSLAFSPDGRFLACALLDDSSLKYEKKIIQVWDWEKKKFKILEGNQTGRITRLVFSPDGSYLVSGSMDGDLFVWKWQQDSYRELTKYNLTGFISNNKKILNSCFSEDNRYLASIISDNTVIVWDLENVTYKTFEDKSVDGYDLVISPDDKYLACGSRVCHSIQIWDLKKGNFLKLDCSPDGCDKESSSDKRDSLRYFPWSYSPCSRWLISVNTHGIIRVWDLDKQEFKILGYDLGFGNYDLRFVDERNVAVISHTESSTKESVQIWNLESGKSRLSDIEKKVTGVCITISPKGNYIASIFRYYTEVGIWDLKKGVYYEFDLLELGFEEGLDYRIKFEFSPEENYLACFTSRSILVWDLENKKSIIKTFSEDKWYSIERVFFSAQENVLGFVYRGTVYMWEWKNSTYLNRLCSVGSPEWFKLNMDGKHGIGCSYNKILAFDLENHTYEEVFSFSDRIIEAVFNPDGRYIAVVLDDLTVQVLNLSKKESRILEYCSELYDRCPYIFFTAKGKQLSIRLENHILYGNITFTYDVETGNVQKRNTLSDGIVLYGTNFQQADLSEDEKLWFRSAGVKV